MREGVMIALRLIDGTDWIGLKLRIGKEGYLYWRLRLARVELLGK